MRLACATFWRVTNALHSARTEYPLSARKSVLNLSFNRRSGEMRVLGLLLTASLWALIAKADQPVYFQSIVTQDSSVFQKIISVGTGNTFVVTNTAVGYQPLAANTTGNYDTAFGYYSLRLNTTGSVNTALGAAALFRNTTGSYNLAVGVEALANSDSGVNNTAVGPYDTLLHNTTGSGNTALGYAALYSSTNSNGNTAVGRLRFTTIPLAHSTLQWADWPEYRATRVRSIRTWASMREP